MNQEHSHKPDLFVDNEPYDWDKPTITEAELRVLAGIPDDAQIFQHIPGSPDKEITPGMTIDLDEHEGPERFSTQAAGSQAG